MQYFLVFVLVMGVLMTIFSNPIFWIIAGILIVLVFKAIVDLFSASSNNIRQSSSFKDWSQSVDKNEPNKKSDDILDEKIPTQELIKLRNILNLIDLSGEFTKDTRDEIIGKLLPVKSSQFDNETATRLKNIDLNTARNFFISYRDMLN